MLTLLLWAGYHRQKSRKYGLKTIFLFPCERWLYKWLAKRQGVEIPNGKIIEMHLDTKIVYAGQNYQEVMEKFHRDLEQDLKQIKKLITYGDIPKDSVIVLNTFNRYWLDKTEQILGGKRYPKTVLAKASCRLYTPKGHQKIFKRMFPGLKLLNPGRNDPERWDLIVSAEREV